MSGFILLHRKLLDWEWYNHIPTKTLFIHCLLRANHTDAKWRGIDIKRGQFITSIATLSKETGLSEKQIRNCLKNLEKTGELGKVSNSVNTCISVLKYESFQSEGQAKGKQRANEGQTKGKRRATNNNDNNENNNNNENKFIFKDSLIDLGVEKEVVEQWLLVREKKNAVNTQIAFDSIKKEILKSNLTPNECIRIAVEKSWKGFKYDWILNLNPQSIQQQTPVKPKFNFGTDDE